MATPYKRAMFQNFDDPSDADARGDRLRLLRDELVRRGLAGFVVPRADEHQNEYVPPSAERLRWLTGFSGSAGMAIVLAGQAALFVDGRYTLQARDQIGDRGFEVVKLPDVPPTKWLEGKLPEGSKLGYDPRLHTVREVERLTKALAKQGVELSPQDVNPIDAEWIDRPAQPIAPIVPHPIEFSGREASEKVADIQAAIAKDRAAAVLITSPESIAWLFNIRGNDMRHVPAPLAFAVVPADGRPTLFVEPRKVGDNVRGHLAAVAVLEDIPELSETFTELGAAKAKVRFDPDTASSYLHRQLKERGVEIVFGADPCALPRAKKNATEIAGARAAQLRDGVALARFLAWLDTHARLGGVDEITAAQTLEAYRRESGRLKDISFDTISGSGPNGAIVHYRVTHRTNRRLRPGELYLIDSGGQYQDGTTDVTRTIAIGEPTAEMRRHFTLVLQGHIAIAAARFPAGTRGQDLDPFARRALWAEGLDFDHGAGHGVGSYLSVHEGPARISKLGSVPIEPGMILSNEPGYYREGQYGIRIENLLLALEPEPIEGGERPMMRFETLTLAPIDRRLIDAALLSPEERAWIDGYHAGVRRSLGAHLDADALAWLHQATTPLDCIAAPGAPPT